MFDLSYSESQLVEFLFIEGDVLSGTTSDGIHHAGVLEGWFGEQWWTGRFLVLVVTTLAVFAPLASLKRIGEFFCSVCNFVY